MPPSDFEIDHTWQRRVRDEILAPGFYGRYATEGRYVFIDKGRLARLLQKRYAVDTILQGKGGEALCIEEKIVRWPGYAYAAFALETMSCTVPGRESPGWMVYGKGDYLNYCFQQQDRSLLLYLMDFPRLQAWFWPRFKLFPPFGPLETLNRTCGRVVPIRDVTAAVRTWCGLIKPS